MNYPSLIVYLDSNKYTLEPNQIHLTGKSSFEPIFLDHNQRKHLFPYLKLGYRTVARTSRGKSTQSLHCLSVPISVYCLSVPTALFCLSVQIIL